MDKDADFFVAFYAVNFMKALVNKYGEDGDKIFEKILEVVPVEDSHSILQYSMQNYDEISDSNASMSLTVFSKDIDLTFNNRTEFVRAIRSSNSDYSLRSAIQIMRSIVDSDNHVKIIFKKNVKETVDKIRSIGYDVF